MKKLSKKQMIKIGTFEKLTGNFRLIRTDDIFKYIDNYSPFEIIKNKKATSKQPIIIKLKNEKGFIVNFKENKAQYYIKPFEIVEKIT